MVTSRLPVEVIERWLVARGTLSEAVGLRDFEFYLEGEEGLSSTRFHVRRVRLGWEEESVTPFYLNFLFTEDELLELVAFVLNEG